MKQKLIRTKVTVRLRKSEYHKEWYIYLESYPVMVVGKEKPQRIREYLNRSVSTVVFDKRRPARTTSNSISFKPKRDDNGIIMCKSNNDQETMAYADSMRKIRQREYDNANLYLVWQNEDLRQSIIEILKIIDQYFIDKETWHLKLFFDENWNERKDVVSYGHDIEAAWLLLWCAEVSNDEVLVKKYRHYAVKIANATLEGLDEDGGLWYEYDPQKNLLIAEKHWWPQAEFWIGCVNAYQITGEEKYLEIFRKNWEFTKNHIIDGKNGEWFWGINADYSKIQKDKAGFWKCPYHNSRACLEIISRLS